MLMQLSVRGLAFLSQGVIVNSFGQGLLYSDQYYHTWDSDIVVHVADKVNSSRHETRMVSDS